MEKLVYITGIIISIVVFYKVISFLYFLSLKTKLKNADLNTFTKVLGEKHKYRTQFNGLKRYKWSKGLVTIKATFDGNGNLTYDKILTHIISKVKSELLFLM